MHALIQKTYIQKYNDIHHQLDNFYRDTVNF